jgi:hypothetical protein
VVFGVVKMETVICRLGSFCVFGIKCRVRYRACRVLWRLCVGVLSRRFCGVEFGCFVSVVQVSR